MRRSRGISYALTLVLAATISLAVFSGRSSASVSGAMGGYAWSDTIGWISLSGSNYGLSIDGSGKLSGYAWSDNIGWITANESELSGCPSNPCRAKWNGNQLAGWLKALAGGTSSSGGWDGWISLSGSNYGVVDNNGVISGYAWGSDVVGWVDFSYATAFAPQCTLSLDPSSITQGQSSTISWSCLNATSCTGTNFSTGGTTSGTLSVSPSQSTTYNGICTGPGGSSEMSSTGATLTVACNPTTVYSCSGQDIVRTVTNSSCSVTVTNPYATCVSPQ